MSATQELIAAALTAAEVFELSARFEDEKNAVEALREACARAMVQPDIAEVERLVQKLESCAGWAGETQGENRRIWREEQDISRTALLDAVRVMAAERDEWQKLRDPATLHANLLRGEPARLTREMLLHLLGDSAPQPVGDVPMPEPDGWLSPDWNVSVRLDFEMFNDGGNIYAAETLRTYGEQCRAAGYTAGVAAVCGQVANALGLGSDGGFASSYLLAQIAECAALEAVVLASRQDAERYRWLRDKSPATWMAQVGDLPLFKGDFDSAIDYEIDAALRGEVKP